MYDCYICNTSVHKINQLITHFKYIHRTNTYYVCKQDNCLQSFNSIHVFKRHLQRKHNSVSNTVGEDFSHTSNQTLINNDSETQHNKSEQCSNNESNTIISPEMSIISDSKIYEGKIKTKIENTALKFSLNLHSKNNFNRKDILDIQKMIKTSITIPIVETMQQMFTQNNILTELFSNFFQQLKDPLEFINTEHKFFLKITELNIFEYPKVYSINRQISEITLSNIPTLAEENIEGVLMPISFQLRKYFESESVFKTTLQNMSDLQIETGMCIQNVINGELWRTKFEHDERYIIPIFLYFDDFGINNPLGPHPTSICAAYYCIPVIPEFYLSKLEHIFLAALFKSSDIENYGNNSTLYPLIRELRIVENEGLPILVDGTYYNVHFPVMLVLGDNLGLNSILGFTKSFSSNYFCRLCKRNNNDTKIDATEYVDSLRNISNYDHDISTYSDVKSRIKLTGLKEESIFNTLQSFHVTDNFVCDIMHDVFEGICHYDLCQILSRFIWTEKLFTLENLNYRKQLFPYGEIEVGNMSPPIQEDHIKNKRLKMNAKEMMTFVHFLPLMIGDLVPQNNKTWLFLCSLLDIIDLILCSSFDSTKLLILKNLIANHNTEYKNIFKDNLKPKHHFLVHYATVIEKSGPIKYLWSMRFEAKHQALKTYARSTSSRKNIPLSLAIKESLKFSNFISHSQIFPPELECTTDKDYTKLENKFYYTKIDNLPFLLQFDYYFLKLCRFKGTLYKYGYFLTNKTSLTVNIYEIIELLIYGRDVYVIGQKWDIQNYDNHIRCYIIKNKSNIFSMQKLNHFDGPPTHSYLLPSGKISIKLKKYVC